MYLILLVAISVSAASPTPPETECNPVCPIEEPIACYYERAPEVPPEGYCGPWPVCALTQADCPCDPQVMEACPPTVCPEGEIWCSDPPVPTPMGKCDCLPSPNCVPDGTDCPATDAPTTDY